MYPICILYVSYMYSICILCVSYMYPICFPYASLYVCYRCFLGMKRYEITSSRCDGKPKSIAENRSIGEANLQQDEDHRRPMCTNGYIWKKLLASWKGSQRSFLGMGQHPIQALGLVLYFSGPSIVSKVKAFVEVSVEPAMH